MLKIKAMYLKSSAFCICIVNHTKTAQGYILNSRHVYDK